VITLPVGTEAFCRAASALTGVLMLLAAGVWLLQRHGGTAVRGPRPSGRLAITSRLALDSRNRLVLVRCDTVEHLLAIGPSGVQLLETLPAPPKHPDAAAGR
jgi:flagellar biogenesis protein FliO